MAHVYSFEKLNAWKESRIWVTWVYKVTADFPADEKFGLISQLRRAAVSVVSNLAEGSARKSAKDQAHFYQMAYSSLIEVLNQLIISNDLMFLGNDKLSEGRTLIENLTVKIAALRNAQLNKVS
ncbi:MAG: four helix bundle protein [Chitinophagaceae bacterium]|nr:four helix bundle protein [Chitinophagaceae bacterium]